MENYILSFDIGIKNLAYCVLKYNQEIKSYDIHDWDVITLIKENDKCNANKMDLLILADRLMTCLDEHTDFKKIPIKFS